MLENKFEKPDSHTEEAGKQAGRGDKPASSPEPPQLMAGAVVVGALKAESRSASAAYLSLMSENDCVLAVFCGGWETGAAVLAELKPDPIG